jgi:hypothetical protein
MPATGYKSGRMWKVYIDPTGAGVGSYSRLTIAKNPKLGVEWDEAVVEDDASVAKRYLKGLVDHPLELEINVKIGDTNYEALRDAAMDPDEHVGIALCTGLITEVGAQLFEADFLVTQFPFDAPISDTSVIAVQLKLAANSSFVPLLSEVEAP